MFGKPKQAKQIFRHTGGIIMTNITLLTYYNTETDLK